MSKKNYTANADGLSAEDRALNTFADLMIDKITNMQQDWKKPWFSPCRSVAKKSQWTFLQRNEQHRLDAHAREKRMADFPICYL